MHLSLINVGHIRVTSGSDPHCYMGQWVIWVTSRDPLPTLSCCTVGRDSPCHADMVKSMITRDQGLIQVGVVLYLISLASFVVRYVTVHGSSEWAKLTSTSLSKRVYIIYTASQRATCSFIPFREAP